MAKVLAFDQSLNFAYAVDRPAGGPPLTSLHRLPFEGEDYGRAFDTAERVINDAIAVHQPDELWREQTIFIRGNNIVTSAQTMMILINLAGLIEKCAYQAERPCFEVGNMVWKKFVVGSGHAKKRDTIDCCRRLGWAPATGHVDNNCADAMGIWAYAKACSDDEFAARLTPLMGADA